MSMWIKKRGKKCLREVKREGEGWDVKIALKR